MGREKVVILISDTYEIVFNDSTLFGYFISGFIYILLPVALYILLKKYNAARIYPVIVGVIVYFLSTRLCDLCAHIAGFSQSYANKAVIAAELVCFFEEFGRWLAIRYPLADIRDTRSAVCYGIGHAGLECWIRGAQKFQIFHYLQQLNNNGIYGFISGRTEEKASAIVKQLQTYADHPLYLSFLDSIHSIFTFFVHIALSLLIYKKMNDKKRWLLLAILLHYCLNGFTWVASLYGDLLLTNFVGIVCDFIVIMIVFKIINGRNCIDEIIYPINDNI